MTFQAKRPKVKEDGETSFRHGYDVVCLKRSTASTLLTLEPSSAFYLVGYLIPVSSVRRMLIAADL